MTISFLLISDSISVGVNVLSVHLRILHSISSSFMIVPGRNCIGSWISISFSKIKESLWIADIRGDMANIWVSTWNESFSCVFVPKSTGWTCWKQILYHTYCKTIYCLPYIMLLCKVVHIQYNDSFIKIIQKQQHIN